MTKAEPVADEECGTTPSQVKNQLHLTGAQTHTYTVNQPTLPVLLVLRNIIINKTDKIKKDILRLSF